MSYPAEASTLKFLFQPRAQLDRGLGHLVSSACIPVSKFFLCRGRFGGKM